MLLPNHTNFMDPHILFDAFRKLKQKAVWMAGIEPFDTMFGFFGWCLQSVGVFSIDRGILDRWAFAMAQDTLDKAEYPLVIYPEGEADYTNTVLRGFYPGAALFALKTAEKYMDSNRRVEVLPLAVRYLFESNVEDTLSQAIHNLAEQMRQKYPNLPVVDVKSGLPEAMMSLMTQSLAFMVREYPKYQPLPDVDFSTQAFSLRDYMLQQLVSEHLPEAETRNLSYDDLMMLKNRLRSLIVRKRHAPLPAELEPMLKQVEALGETLKSRELTSHARKELSRLEARWIGLALEEHPDKERVRQLGKHLKQQVPYARIRQAASLEDLSCWDRQVNDTRRIKLLTLLVEDWQRKDISAEGIDDTLVKLEIMLFSRFLYRGPKKAVLRVGEPIDVKAFLKENSTLDKRALPSALLDLAYQQMQLLLDACEARKYSEAEPVSV